MKSGIDFSKVVAIGAMKGEDDEETAQLKELFVRAKEYLCSFSWCKRIIDSFFGIGIGRPLGVFLFRIEPSHENVDEWIWVIVGDLPPAYITTDQAPNPAAALDGYIGAMEEWVTAVRMGKPTKDLIPVNAQPTLEWADELEWRLRFIDREILSFHKDDLKK
jgi:hypothetical protein